ncbi:MAG: hypothetical protein KDC35_07920 [Acidobacteria bacterium]|nr:hypothetical protein [Acidobacteriota bacterium]
MDPGNRLRDTIVTTEEELVQRRQALARKLIHAPNPQRFWPFAVPVLAAALALMILFWPAASLDRADIDTLNAFLSENQAETVRIQAHKLINSGSFTAQTNGHYLMAMSQPNGQGLGALLAALEAQPPYPYRQIYLERLIDLSDSYRLGDDLLDHWVDLETDPLCMDLLEVLVTANSG